MREVRIYQPGDYTSGQTIELSPAARQHVGKVLRMQTGHALTLFCGDNREFSATIYDVGKKSVHATINIVESVNRESPQIIHLAQGISKGSRMDMVIQKAVELGVTSITPVITERSVVRLDPQRWEKKQCQWQNIAISACEQCGRNVIPQIHKPTSLSTYLKQSQAMLKLILSPNAERSWRDYSLAKEEIALLIGPEGGLSETEIMHVQSMDFQPLSLGPRILRTETAAITALSVLQAVNGDL